MKDGKRSSGRIARVLLAGALATVTVPSANAQMGPPGPPAVGVMEATKRPITESNEFLGRVEATNRVNVVARVTAFLEKRDFVEGAEVKNGDLLYQLERGPFEADLKSKQAQVAQLQATLVNAKLTTDRAKTLLSGPAGQQSTYDAALANQQSLEAQIQAAAGAGRSVADQSRLYPDPLADRRQDRPHRRDRRQRGHAEFRYADHASSARTRCMSPSRSRCARDCQLRDRYATRGGFKAVVIRIAAAGRPALRPGRPVEFRQQHDRAEHRHHHAARNDSQSDPERIVGKRNDARAHRQ